MNKSNKKIDNALEFIEYISKPMERSDILLYFKIHNVKIEKLNLYVDFTETLYHYVTTTYMGDDITDDMDKIKHFNWCWSKTINGFKKEKIYFNDDELYMYFLSFYEESFYKENDKSEKNITKLKQYWGKIFNFYMVKTKSELDTLIELYKIFDKSLGNTI